MAELDRAGTKHLDLRTATQTWGERLRQMGALARVGGVGALSAAHYTKALPEGISGAYNAEPGERMQGFSEGMERSVRSHPGGDWLIEQEEAAMLAADEAGVGKGLQFMADVGSPDFGDIGRIAAFKARHVSPHLFDRFKHNPNAGTGGQMQGSGHYFYDPENEKVGDYYRGVFEDPRFAGPEPGYSGPYTYDVTVDAEPVDDFLHWDKPLHDQPEPVRNALSHDMTGLQEKVRTMESDALKRGGLAKDELYDRAMGGLGPPSPDDARLVEIQRKIQALDRVNRAKFGDRAGYPAGRADEMPGHGLVSAMGNDKLASDAMSRLGVKGNAYLDAASREVESIITVGDTKLDDMVQHSYEAFTATALRHTDGDVGEARKFLQEVHGEWSAEVAKEMGTGSRGEVVAKKRVKQYEDALRTIDEWEGWGVLREEPRRTYNRVVYPENEGLITIDAVTDAQGRKIR